MAGGCIFSYSRALSVFRKERIFVIYTTKSAPLEICVGTRPVYFSFTFQSDSWCRTVINFKLAKSSLFCPFQVYPTTSFLPLFSMQHLIEPNRASSWSKQSVCLSGTELHFGWNRASSWAQCNMHSASLHALFRFDAIMRLSKMPFLFPNRT